MNKPAESNYLFAASNGTISLGAGYSLSAASQTTQYRYALCSGETYSEEYLEGDNVMTGRVKNADGEQFLEADTVIIAVGTRALETERDQFTDAAFDVISAGDCVKASSIVHAVHSGFDAGLTL